MNASRCCEGRAFCLHMPLMVTLIDVPDAANEASSPPRAGAARFIRRAGASSDARSSSGRRDDAGASRETP